MLSDQQYDQLIDAFPCFKEDPVLLSHLRANSSFATPEQEKTLCHDGQRSNALPLLISGVIKVYKISESGKEITLYHIVDGESCVLTAASILGSKPFPAIAATEQDSEVVLVPTQTVQDWLLKSQQWQHFIFELIALRMTEMITVVEEVAFQRKDKRIAKYLLARLTAEDSSIQITHQEIGADIGTAREVVTRVLRDLDRKKILQLTRRNIRIIDIKALQELIR